MRPIQPSELKWKLVSDKRFMNLVFWPAMWVLMLLAAVLTPFVYGWCWLRGRPFNPKTRTPHYSGRK